MLQVRIFAFLFPLIVFAPVLSAAQDCTLVLSGIVKEKNGEQLPGATVVLVGRSAVADADGKFRFLNLCPGTLQL
ncbi:MAG TPA: hypothetical protein PKX08_02405, partial [Cyclobacteriaceae bacterium]|nr:hypothetical protein [Cyclobacteriaceae bacterium]